MPFPTPATVTPGVTAMAGSDFNNHANGLSYLAARSLTHSVYQNAGADYSLTATSWTDVDAANVSGQITPGLANARILVRFIFMVSAISGGGTSVYFDVSDGTNRSAGTNGVLLTSFVGQQVVEAYFTGVAASLKTYKLQYQVSSGTTVTLKRSSFPIVIHIQEV